VLIWATLAGLIIGRVVVAMRLGDASPP
jgi:hypothetical protein